MVLLVELVAGFRGSAIGVIRHANGPLGMAWGRRSAAKSRRSTLCKAVEAEARVAC